MMYDIRFMNAKISTRTVLKTVCIHSQFKIYCHLKVADCSADEKLIISSLIQVENSKKKSPLPSFTFLSIKLLFIKFNIHEPIRFR